MRVDVIAYAPTVFYHCQHCELTFRHMGVGERVHREEAREALPHDLLDEFHVLSEWVRHLVDRHRDRIRVRVVDAASMEGFWRSLRHRITSYPALVIDGRSYPGSDLGAAETEIEARLGQRTSSEHGERG